MAGKGLASMPKYASETSVSCENSRAEIERTIRRYGAKNFAFGMEGDRAAVMFEMQGRRVRFVLVMPPESQFARTPQRKTLRSPKERLAAHEQACRQRWRALALAIKAKLEAVESGISCFEDEFMAHIVLPDGSTVGEFMRPQIATAYTAGTMPRMLLGSDQ